MKRFNPFIYNSHHHVESSNYLYLLGALTAILLLPLIISFFPEYQNIISTVTFNIMLLVGVYTATTTKKDLLVGLGLGFLSWALLWLGFASSKNVIIRFFSQFALLNFYAFLAYHVFLSLRHYIKLSNDIVYAAICGFLILGFMGGQFVILLEILRPGSFEHLSESYFNHHYYSFVTLTTLGYGDIVPLTSAAKSMSILISLAGQLYLTTIVAMFVGKYIANNH